MTIASTIETAGVIQSIRHWILGLIFCLRGSDVVTAKTSHWIASMNRGIPNTAVPLLLQPLTLLAASKCVGIMSGRLFHITSPNITGMIRMILVDIIVHLYFFSILISIPQAQSAGGIAGQMSDLALR